MRTTIAVVVTACVTFFLTILFLSAGMADQVEAALNACGGL